MNASLAYCTSNKRMTKKRKNLSYALDSYLKNLIEKRHNTIFNLHPVLL